MKRQLSLFFGAMMFYTRIPVPKKYNNHHTQTSNLSDSIRFIPVVGWIVGAVAGLVFIALKILLNNQIALALSMLSSVFMTGAFHEDGFADVCDGFGGGWTKEKILLIMKDSRLGTYGVTGLLFMLGIKYLSLSQLIVNDSIKAYPFTIILIFVTAHSISRLSAASLIFFLNYVPSENSKSLSATLPSSRSNLYIAFILALIPLLVLSCTSGILMGIILIPVLVVTIYCARYFKKWIGGYTGDCLGAVQQITEVIIYLSIITIWKSI